MALRCVKLSKRAPISFHTYLRVQTVCFPGHTAIQWSIVVSIFCAGAPFGATLGGICAGMQQLVWRQQQT
jgi:hypothetical protein